MQPVQAQKGVSTKSQLSDSLKVYLNNKNRLQPIIGLDSIIECVRAGTHSREALYLCEVCACRLTKADIRNHIVGSLHRYNYIKAWHPHLVSEWKEKSDLSKLAWPLMEKAKILEGKEGSGDIQLLEVEDAVYQRMATCNENDAVKLIHVLRDGQGNPVSHSETTSCQLGLYPIQSQRTVFAQNQWTRSRKTSAETNTPPSLRQSTVAPSEAWLNYRPESLWDKTQTSPEPSVLSENSFLYGYTGTEPLIGLFSVVECRSEAGHTYCFLCHCCRIRSNKKDIIDHLTSSSHLLNYLMEIHPEQMEVMMEDINDNYQLIQSLARRVEQEEGRGELKVVNAPESLCNLLNGKSYHWCVKMLCNGQAGTNIQKRKIAVKGPSVTSDPGMSEEGAVVLMEGAKKMKPKRKKRKVSYTVFKVSLPLTKGSVLLERTSLSVDRLPAPSAPPSNSDRIPSPGSQAENCELDRDTGSFVNHAEHASVCAIGTKDPRFDVEKNYNRLDNSEERLYNQGQNEGPQTLNEWLLPAVSHTQDWSAYNSSYGCEEGYTEQWYNSASQSKVCRRVDVSGEERQKGMSSESVHYDHQQQPSYQPHQYMAQHHASLLTGSVGQHVLSGAPHSDAAWTNVHPNFGDSLVHSGNIAAEPRAQFLQPEQRQWQTYMEFQVGPGVMFYPSYNTGPTTNPDQHFPHPSV